MQVFGASGLGDLSAINVQTFQSLCGDLASQTETVQRLAWLIDGSGANLPCSLIPVAADAVPAQRLA